MRSLRAPRRSFQRAATRDPAPSRLAYRWQRMWLTPLWRAVFRMGLPGFAAAAAVGLYLSDDDRRAAIASGVETVRTSVEQRPEFMVNLMTVKGASPGLVEAIRAALPVDLPQSSFDLDLEALRLGAAALDAVAAVDVHIRPGGILEVVVSERVPAILWRSGEGLWLLDAEGHRVAPVGSRLERPDLPIVAGEGAERMVPEALRLVSAAAPIGPRLRGLVRMGERRWDVVLDRGQRILLPEEEAVRALERVLALAQAEEMLDRDVTVIDLRQADRPTLRLTPEALEDLRQMKTLAAGATNG